MARYEGHSGIERAAAGLIEKFPIFTFTERGGVSRQGLSAAVEADRRWSK
jgi:hypothetical protein